MLFGSWNIFNTSWVILVNCWRIISEVTDCNKGSASGLIGCWLQHLWTGNRQPISTDTHVEKYNTLTSSIAAAEKKLFQFSFYFLCILYVNQNWVTVSMTMISMAQTFSLFTITEESSATSFSSVKYRTFLHKYNVRSLRSPPVSPQSRRSPDCGPAASRLPTNNRWDCRTRQ